MFVIANLLIALAQVLDYVLWAYMWILIGRIIVSWVNADYSNPIVRFLYAATEPVLEPVRRRLPRWMCRWSSACFTRSSCTTKTMSRSSWKTATSMPPSRRITWSKTSRAKRPTNT